MENTPTPDEIKTNSWGIIVAGILVATFLIPLLGILSNDSSNLPDCRLDTNGRPTPTRSLNGVIREASKSVFIHSDKGGDSYLGGCIYKGGCDNELPNILYQKAGQPVHAEFCGQMLTRVLFDGNEIYQAVPKSPATQMRTGLFLHSWILALLAIPIGLIGYGIHTLRQKS